MSIESKVPSIAQVTPPSAPLVEIDLGHLGRTQPPPTLDSVATSWVAFDYFDYRATPPSPQAVPMPGPDEYLNPILPGFYPDPSICRVGRDYYLVNSSFALHPGLPIFHSVDLVHWTPLGHVLDRPSQMKSLTGITASGGLYAPSLRYVAGKFVITCTMVGGGGNFLVTADRAEGPWSDPIWTPSVHGIDPSPFFEDGRLYIVHNGDCPGTPRYDGHKAIWLQEVDLVTGEQRGPSHLLVDGGTDLSKKPIWIEGPHIFRRKDHYYLIAAEGGTGEDHSVVAFRSKTLTGPYEPAPTNPLLTQRDLPEDRENKVTCTGHADFVELPDGQWWAVFLGCRPYVGNHYNTGRETFLLPVTWPENGWPAILPPGDRLPIIARRPKLGATGHLPARQVPGDHFARFRDDFDLPAVGSDWVTLRYRSERWMHISEGALRLAPRTASLHESKAPSFAAIRQRHAHFTATTRLDVSDLTANCDAGLVAFQDEGHHLFLGVRVRGGQCREVFVEQVGGVGSKGVPAELARFTLTPGTRSLELSLSGRGGPHDLRFRLQAGSGTWQDLLLDFDGKALSTASAGGFQGVCLGLFSRAPTSQVLSGMAKSLGV